MMPAFFHNIAPLLPIKKPLSLNFINFVLILNKLSFVFLLLIFYLRRRGNQKRQAASLQPRSACTTPQ
jgi:hypothetical protein